jgi:putative nucleotidyltransferase with HDIG domain
MRGFGRLSWPGRVYFASVILAGVAIVPIGWVLHPVDFALAPQLIYLGIATQIAALMPIKWHRGIQLVWTAPMVAIGLEAPGGGVALAGWLCTYDGRVPGRDHPWFHAAFNRAECALYHGIPSLIVQLIPGDPSWGIAMRAAAYSCMVLVFNYGLTGIAVSFLTKQPVLRTISENVHLAAVQSVLGLGLVGGIMYVLLRPNLGYVGYFLMPALLGTLVAVRNNIAYAQNERETRLQALQLAAQALDARDPFTESHSLRVSELAVALGRELDLGGKVLEHLANAGHLHDLGKIGIRDEILNKRGPLSPEEWEIMRAHSNIGANMIAKYGAFADIVPMVRHHHERWDGSGYPTGLAGHKIPLGARILAVADSFDTITEARLYRLTKLSPAEAVRDITRRSGSWYDPVVVDALRHLHGLEPTQTREETPATPGLSLSLLKRHPRLAHLLLANTISSLGDPLTTVATLVSVYLVTRQPLAVAATYIVKAVATIAVAGIAGAATDRYRRRPLIVRLELVRAALLLLTPLLLHIALGLLFPIIFLLAAINALVQPARQAAVAEIVSGDEIGSANAAVTLTTVVGGFVGFPLAGLILWVTANSTGWLFVVDGTTFLATAALMAGLGNLGGGAVQAKLHGAIKRAWRAPQARPHLLVAAVAAFFLSMSYPTLIVLAYQQHLPGAQAYTILEGALALGIVMGSVYVGRIARIGSMATVVAGVALTGLMSILVALEPEFWLIALLLLVASVGNPLYAVGNQTALVQSVPAAERGSVMAIRFAIVQTALITGAAFGGVVTQSLGPRLTYGILGAGLCLVALAALAFRPHAVIQEPSYVIHRLPESARLAPTTGEIGGTATEVRHSLNGNEFGEATIEVEHSPASTSSG